MQKNKGCDAVILSNACQSILMMELAAVKMENIGNCCMAFFKLKYFKCCEDILKKTNTSRNEWHSERQFRITGSRIHEIFTYKGKDWAAKSKKYFFPKNFTNKFVKHGLEQEPCARQVFIEKTGYTVIECGLVVPQSNPWLGYSPDGVIIDDRQYPISLLEIKCPFHGKKCYMVKCLFYMIIEKFF